MRLVFHALSILAVVLSLNACRTTTGKQEPNVGPYDSHGRYVDAWADDPSKWRPYTPKDVEGDPPRIAKNEQPLDYSVPLAPGDSAAGRVTPARGGSDSTHSVARVATTKTKADAERTTARTSSKTKADAERTIAKTSSKTKAGAERTTAKTSSKTKADAERGTGKTASKTKTDADQSAKTTSKSKSGASKTASKSKTGSTHHTVKPGDSLYTIAAKYGTSVSALKEANGISGTVIRDGKVLVIPARK